MGKLISTFQYRIKDSTSRKRLERHARATNFVWNYCNNAQKHALHHGQKWPSAFDLCRLTVGTSKELKLHSQTIKIICGQYDQSRRAKKKRYLRYRGKRTLGWIPFSRKGVSLAETGFKYQGSVYRVWYSRPIPKEAIIRCGSFSQDARGHWYVNVTFEIESKKPLCPRKEVGIDLGLKDFAAFSNGDKIEAKRIYRSVEKKLATAQRARKKKRVRAIHVGIKNKRKDFHHKLSTKVAREFGLIVVGNVDASKLAKTKMAKSVLDAGWSAFRQMLRYKAIAHGGIFLEVSEAYTTQDCSVCGSRAGPKGLEQLGIREWACPQCASVHDRDINAARNILRAGHRTLAEGILVNLRE